MSLPQSVITEDNRLEAAEEAASKQLTYHRWHWTMDEANPERVSFTEYARAIGRTHTTVAKQAKGYAAWQESGEEHALHEAIDRAQVSVERQAAIDAVATASGTSFRKVRQGRSEEVREVAGQARERAERLGTSYEEEVEQVAEQRQKFRESAATASGNRKARHGLRYVEVEGHLAAAKRRLTDALKVAQDVGFDDEEIELITDSLAQVRAVLNLIDMRIAGKTDVDWDVELAKLTKET